MNISCWYKYYGSVYVIIFSSLLSVYRTFDAWDLMLVLAMIMKSTDRQLLAGKPEIVWFSLSMLLPFHPTSLNVISVN
jgi:hypothetical protein